MSDDHPFGDYEPEDAWDDNDPPVEQLRNLRRRLALLVLAELVSSGSLLDEWTKIRDALDIVRTRMLDARQQLRIEQLDDDLEHVRTRI